MKFVNSKRFSPVVFEEDLPDPQDYFHKTPETIDKEFLKKGNYFIDVAWWSKQIDRCMNGYTVKDAIAPGGDMMIDGIDAIWYPNGDCYIPLYDLLIKDRTVWISGRHYFYLNFWPIYGTKKGSKSKGLTNPRFLGMDFFFAMRVEMMFDQNKDGQELKCRQIGISEKGAGMVIGYNYTFYPDSQNLIIGGVQADADHTMQRTIEGLDNLANTQFYKERKRGGDSKKYVKAKNYGAEIYSLTAKNDFQTASRFSPFVVWYEEIGKGVKGWSLEVAKYIDPSIETEGEKTGWQFFIGTAGEMDEGIYDLELRHYNPEEYNILSFDNVFEKENPDQSVKVGHFTGKDWYLKVDEDGNPLRRESRMDILRRRSLKKPEDRYKFITQRPIYASEAFLTTVAGFFGEYKIQLLNARKTQLRTKKELQVVRTGRLEFIEGTNWKKGFKFEPDETNGWLKIIEEPELDEKDHHYRGLYRGGCLLPGEKVITNDGLKNAENVFENDKLVNEYGDYVEIQNFFKRMKIDSDVYTIKSGNTFRTNTVTEEHPVLITKPKFHSDKTVNEDAFDFSYEQAKDINVGDWTRVPNLYNKESKDLIMCSLWDDENCRIDRRIDNPLFDKDFWWFVGLWLGDGYCDNHYKKISISINSKESFYLKKLEEIVLRLFNRKVSCRKRNGSTECTFSISQLNLFLTKHFGKYSYGKRIPEWAKYIKKDLKRSLMLGYLDSDGCISKHLRGYYNIQYISVNLELLESIQDIGFSLGIVSSLCKLRDASVHIFPGNPKKSKTRECYQLRFTHHDTLNLVEQLDCKNDLKIQRIDFKNLPKVRRRPKDSCFLSADNRFIYFKIKNIEKEKYTGTVYNFECDTHTYIGHHIGYHNCDSYDQDEAHTSKSKGAMYIKKGFNPYKKESVANLYVAQILERPSVEHGGAEAFYLHCAMAGIWFGCFGNINIEYSNLRIFQWFSDHGYDFLLKERPRLAFAGMIGKSQVSNRYGTDRALKPQILAIGSSSLTEDSINNMYFIEMVVALAQYRYDPSGKKYNCDITIAFCETEVGMKEDELIPVTKVDAHKETDKKGFLVYKRSANGISSKFV